MFSHHFSALHPVHTTGRRRSPECRNIIFRVDHQPGSPRVHVPCAHNFLKNCRIGPCILEVKCVQPPQVLKAEKRALKIKLRRFEEEFVRKNGHKPQSYQEVGAIRDDYTRYKYLKEAVAGN